MHGADVSAARLHRAPRRDWRRFGVRRTYVLADSTKFGVVGSFEVGTWHDLTGLIADRVPPDGIAAAARRAGSELVVASPRK